MSESIAFRSPNWLGDAVLATVVPPELQRGQPGARVDVLAPRGLADVYAKHPAVGRVVELDRRGEVDAYRRGGYDRAVIAPGSFGAAWRVFRAGIPDRAGFATSSRGALLTRSLPSREDSRARHQVENYRALGRLGAGDGPDRISGGASRPDAAGAANEIEPRVVLDPSWSADAAALWPERHPRRVAIMPGAAYGPAKRWFSERFAALARALDAEGVDVALVGGPGDRDVIDRIAPRVPSSVSDLAGRTRVGVLAALLQRAALLVTNDTGPMHLAAAVGTPVFALFGSTNPHWTRPWGSRHRTLVGPAPCAPCYQRTCRIGTLCFEGISVEAVLREALEMIRGAA